MTRSGRLWGSMPSAAEILGKILDKRLVHTPPDGAKDIEAQRREHLLSQQVRRDKINSVLVDSGTVEELHGLAVVLKNKGAREVSNLVCGLEWTWGETMPGRKSNEGEFGRMRAYYSIRVGAVLKSDDAGDWADETKMNARIAGVLPIIGNKVRRNAIFVEDGSDRTIFVKNGTRNTRTRLASTLAKACLNPKLELRPIY